MAIHKHYKYIIIGAGPTGLGAAWRLKELGIKDFIILERNGYAGGLANTFTDNNGFLWDIGGHVQFSHYHYFDKVMDTAIAPEEWNTHLRYSFVYMLQRFVPYPFQRNLSFLPQHVIDQCIEGLEKRDKESAIETFLDWIYSAFGHGIAQHFMVPYNYKVWAYPPEMLNHNWLSERVATVNLNDVKEQLRQPKTEDNWGPNATFKFPKHGGTGAIWKNVADLIGKEYFKFNQKVYRIHTGNNIIPLGNDKYFSFAHLLSTMPLDSLCKKLHHKHPALERESSKLLYSNTHVVGIGLKGKVPDHLKSKSWMYFPENNSPYYRVTVFSNYSKNNVPQDGDYWSLMTETSASSYKNVNEQVLTEQTITALLEDGLIKNRENVVSAFHHKEEYGYPTPSLERDAILDKVIPKLEAVNIYSRGRFGAWKYEVSNQDHSFMQGVEWVNRMERQSKEDTFNQPNWVNARPKE